ncbi:hemerythrin domain-containing protein [Pelagibius sp. Alg239-R121]|uniref:hemerythrin domain-containing protein n=1 Tax=Pelagibius sp. Alg239-R121 TaxID=2993448 RepID=UPI0024A66D6A|nr:hemerythrin domain-containing protein [Pelagibius sp. Alg239-R121]
MTEAIQTLRSEHKTTARMLDLLERQITLFEETQQPDYDLLKEVIDYFLTYPDLYHHPKENLILEVLRRKAPEAAAPVGDIEREHAEISSRLHDFAHAVVEVLMEAEVSRDAFVKIARDFVEEQRRHMIKEEQVFFPAALKALTPVDWEAIDKKVSRFNDPLTATESELRFDSLRQMLRR